MKGYSETNVFSMAELSLLHRATTLIDLFDCSDNINSVRCHELTRAVGLLLDLPVQDGWCGMVDHSWLWTEPKPVVTGRGHLPPWALPNVLDVYAVGRLPQVQLVSVRHAAPGYLQIYRPSPVRRKDIDEVVVRMLVDRIRDAVRDHPKYKTIVVEKYHC